MRRVWATVVVGCLLTLLAACGGTQRTASVSPTSVRAEPTPTPTPPAAVVIDSPRDGSRTRKRFAALTLGVPPIPKGADKILRVQAGSWLSRWVGRRATVPLKLGRNRIEAHLTVEFIDNDTLVVTPISKSEASISVTRLRGRDYGRLDRATALMVTESSRAVYWLCGESDDCGTQTWCFRVSDRRIDCPVGRFEYPSRIRRCAFVGTVHVRHRRIYFGQYACSGPVTPGPRRHVRADVFVSGRRFRAGHQLATERTALGLPRFDYRRDLFIP